MTGNTVAPKLSPYSIFISYAHKDYDERMDESKRWHEQLLVHLAILARQNQVCVWSDKDIPLGENWHALIQATLSAAKAAVLIVGPEFLRSDYIMKYELPVLLQKAHEEALPIVPIVVRFCTVGETVFNYPDPQHGPHQTSLTTFQLANPPDKPLNSMQQFEQDRVFLKVAQHLLGLVGSNGVKPNVDAPESQVQAVNNALNLLRTLIRENAEVRDALRIFHTDFEATSAQVDLLSTYKDLHDLLHTLQFQCCDLMAAELPHFPQDDDSRDRLISPELTLQQTIDAIREQQPRWTEVNIETEWLLAQLEMSLAKLQESLVASDRGLLSRAVSILSRVLNRYPAQLNARLLEVARGLRLARLVSAMTDIPRRLGEVGVGETEAQQFVDGISGLAGLDVRLRELLYEHDHWQMADGEMRLLQVSSDDFFEDLRASWPGLTVLTKVLYHENPKPWAARFKADSERLDAAIAGTSISAVRECFRRYRRAAGIRFFEVDVELKRLCNELQQVGAPLDRLLSVLDRDGKG
ncbi:MAG: hypothetical protein QOE77_1595 [Blastocatellia bacterium]|jgi:hypothetical protein|nr:hypothetical protein [Blastocatellia bacterium]